MSDTFITTAKGLGRFRKELTAEGIPDELADDLVREAARQILQDGLAVNDDV